MRTLAVTSPLAWSMSIGCSSTQSWSARAAAVRRRDRRREAETRGMPTVPLARCADRYSANE